MAKVLLLEAELVPSPMVAVTLKAAACEVAAVGVPLIIPSLLKVSPAGREPLKITQFTATPSSASASGFWEYSTPT